MRIVTVKVKCYTTLNATAEIRAAFWWDHSSSPRDPSLLSAVVTAGLKHENDSFQCLWCSAAFHLHFCSWQYRLTTAALVSSFDKVGRDNVFLVAPQFSLAFFLLLPRPFFSFSVNKLDPSNVIQEFFVPMICSVKTKLFPFVELLCGCFLPCTSRFTSTSVQIQIIHVVADQWSAAVSLLVFKFIECSVSSFSVYLHRFGKWSWFWEATGLTHVTIKMTFDLWIWNHRFTLLSWKLVWNFVMISAD